MTYWYHIGVIYNTVGSSITVSIQVLWVYCGSGL